MSIPAYSGLKIFIKDITGYTLRTAVMLASSRKHKIGDDQRSQPERGTHEKRNPKGTAHRRRKRREKQHRTVRA
jgi:hypothetical protein